MCSYSSRQNLRTTGQSAFNYITQVGVLQTTVLQDDVYRLFILQARALSFVMRTY